MYQQYLSNLSGAATNLAEQPYNPYPGPTVAAPSSATTQSWQMAQNDVGNWQPDVAQAGALTQASAMGVSPTAVNPENVYAGTVDPTSVTAGQVNYQNLTGGQIQNYMNPYMGTVLGGLESAANTNLTQNVMPSVASQFVSAGQAASPQQAQAVGNAVYQSGQALDQSMSGALQAGYSTATNTALAEQQGALSAGEYNVGQNLAGQEYNAGQNLAGQEFNVGQNLSQQEYNAGQNLSGQEYNAGQDLSSQEYNRSAEQTAGAQMGTLGALQQQLGAGDVGEIAASGQAQDTFNQANLNAAQDSFYQQQQWPYEQLGFLSDTLRGMQLPTTQQQSELSYSPGQTYSASPLSTFGSTYAGASALGLRRGGRITGKRRGGALSHYLKAA